ncbi:MAG: ABC transporter substrate-binding protein [Chloroflexota bacterium]
MRRTIYLITALLLILSACASPPPETASDGTDADAVMTTDHYPVTIIHEQGEETFEAAPERIIVIREELLETLLAVGVQPVGYGGRVDAPAGDEITNHPYLSQEILGTPTYIGEATEPSLERMAALNPDLILWPSDGGANSDIYDSIAQIAPTLAYNPGEPGAWKDILTQLGILFNREAQAAQAIADYDTNVESLRSQLTDVVA